MKKVTLKDIATELGVTVGTVSHVLNGIDDISKETRDKVLNAARKLGYISNGSAVSLRSGKTNTIAIIVPDISNPHISYQIKLIENKMRQANYSVIILNTNEDEKTEYEAIVTACNKRVDGILLCPAQHSLQNIEFLNKFDVPYVLIGRYFAELDTDYVCADDHKGGYIAGKYLLEHGCKNPLYLGAYAYIQSSGNRFFGICKAFEEKNIRLSNERFIQTSPNVENIQETLEEIFDKKIVFDSIVAYSDLIAFKILLEIKKRFKERPIPIVSFDAVNSHLFLPFHSLSIGMVNDGWADKASSVLIDKINGKTIECKELIDVKLYEFND